MAFLVPDAVRTENGVIIKEKIIPWGAVWQHDSGSYKKGRKYKSDKLLSGGTGKVQWVTIHNTGRISHSSKTTAAEQYTRATYPNCNMGTVRVHYFVDGTEAWQNLREDEIGWHAADGNSGGGNGTSVAIECIMNGSWDSEDKKSYDNCARLTAYLLKKYGLTTYNIMSHYVWMRKKGSKSPRYCPANILPVWEDFKTLVQKYLDASADTEKAAPEQDSPDCIKVSDALRAFRLAAGIGKPAEGDLERLDTDGDGKITVSDALRLFRTAAGGQ